MRDFFALVALGVFGRFGVLRLFPLVFFVLVDVASWASSSAVVDGIGSGSNLVLVLVGLDVVVDVFFVCVVVVSAI